VLQDFPESRLEPCPDVLDGVQVRRVRREEQHDATVLPRHLLQDRLPVETGVVHHDDVPLPKGGEQPQAEPALKELAVHRAPVVEGLDHAAPVQARDDAGALIPPPGDQPPDGDAPGGPRVGTVQVLAYPHLVGAGDCFRAEAGEGFEEGFAQPFVTLLVGLRFFLSVNPILLSAYQTAE